MLANNSSIPADAVTLIQQAIVQAFAGTDGGPRAKIGAPIFASRYYGPVYALGSWAQIVRIKVGSSSSPSASFSGSISDSTLTVVSLDSGSISAGQHIIGDGILPGTIVVSGAGSTWLLSTIQTVGPSAMLGVVANSDEIVMGISESPVTAAGDTDVTVV